MPGFRLDRAQPVIHQVALVVVHQPAVAAPTVQVARELHHVVGAAAFLVMRADVHLRGKMIGIDEPVLVVARSAGRVGARFGDGLKEEPAHIAEAVVGAELVAPRCADHLRNVRVHVLALERIRAAAPAA